MPRYIAFLRGINVGGHRVKMASLREVFQELGFENVRTFLVSGNVIFSRFSGGRVTSQVSGSSHKYGRVLLCRG